MHGCNESSHRLIDSEYQSDGLRPASLYKTIENLAKCRRRFFDLESIPVIRQYPLGKFDGFGDRQLIKLITAIRRCHANSCSVFKTLQLFAWQRRIAVISLISWRSPKPSNLPSGYWRITGMLSRSKKRRRHLARFSIVL